MTKTIRWAAAALTLGLCSPLMAQWRIGQTSGFTGPAAAGVKENTDGAKLYFDAVNKAGGIAGQNIELISLDDKFEPALAAENAKKLIDQGVIALFMTRGTPHVQAILPLLAPNKIPLVAPSTGAMVLHQPVQPWVYNVRATYQKEAERAVRHLSLTGTTRIALLHVDDSFGNDAVQGAVKGFDAVGLKPVRIEKFDRTKPEFAADIAHIVKADAQAVIFIGSAGSVADGIKQLRAAGSRALVVTLSNNASAGFAKSLGDLGRGVIVTQVMPYERATSNAMVKEATALLAKQGGNVELTPAMLEGFAGAKVLVEAMKRSGKDITREKLKASLDSFKRFDLGGLDVSFSPTDHTGMDYTDLSIIGDDGKFRR